LLITFCKKVGLIFFYVTPFVYIYTVIKLKRIMARQTRNYEMGYLPKIAYHMAGNCPASVEHFTDRQIQRYGNITSEQMEWICREVAHIHRMWKIEERESKLHAGYVW